jgi:PAS domain S-box-containing protein
MADPGDVFARAVAGMTADASLGGLAGPDAALLLWETSGERLLWASPAAQELRTALAAGPAGTVAADPRLLSRLRALAGGLAPQAGFRLERLRLDPSGLAAATTCACRRIVLPSGDEALLTAILGPTPKRTTRHLGGSAPAAGEPPVASDAADRDEAQSAMAPPSTDPGPLATPELAGEGTSALPDEPAAESAEARDPVAYLRPRGKVRFVWQADAAGRFTEISDLLAGIVGVERAKIIGRGWDEIVGPDIEDPSGRVSQAFAARETWSGETVFWRIRATDFLIPVEFAGSPVFDRDGELVGYRGFGLFRTGEIVERGRRDAAAETEHRPVAAPAAEPPADARAGIEERLEPPGAEAAEVPPSVPEAAEAPSAGSRSEPEPTEIEGTESRLAEPTGDALPSKVATSSAPEALPALVAPPTEPATRAVEIVRLPRRSSGEMAGNDLPAATRSAPADAARRPAPLSRLSLAERSAFREIARALGARFEGDEPAATDAAEPGGAGAVERPSTVKPIRPAAQTEASAAAILDGLPIGVLIHRGEEALFANRHLLELAGYDGLEQLGRAGGVRRLLPSYAGASEESASTTLATRTDDSVALEVHHSRLNWEGGPAGIMLLRRAHEAEQRLRAAELDLKAKEARLAELSAILDTATDGVIVLDDGGRILSLNRSAEALFGYEQNEVAGDTFIVLLAPESHGLARDYLEGLRTNGVASILNDGREVMGRVRQGGTIPLFMTIGRVGDEPERKFCAVLRDITAFKKAEAELLAAKRAAEEGSAHKSDFLAKVSHEVRSPLNAIIGFAEVMLEQRFGPVGNERYKDYLRDIHASGAQVVKLVNDLVDLAEIEAGRMELAFAGVNLNERVAETVVQLQPEAARRRIVMRTSFAPKLPPVVADERSIRQIALNVVSNAIKFTEPGGQVIVSTATADQGGVAIRVRDTGVGMTDEEVRAALAPFGGRSGAPRGATGLGLPLTRALVEANRGALHITSARDEGTLVEVVFPPTRVLAE